MLETCSELIFLVQICGEEGERGPLHFAIRHSVHELPFSLVRNVGPTCRIVGAAHRAEAKPNHIDGRATETKRGIAVELHDPATFECANGIEQKPWCGQINVDSLSFSFDVATDDKRREKWGGNIYQQGRCTCAMRRRNLVSRTTQ